ncbi:9422_t:CDS:1 [Cetraspora pellucida]|uniref:9422_t:CDS:1 n=1 Tax=Cetraspora pellucida TaxID=1433469 RepID=A0A9N8Z5S3_9GLOM|nr:9422_t:CDS:1 [Cetraspora pellucida]
MSHSNLQKRGRYATNACTNCRKRHVKCSQGTTCKNCASRNLMCIYTEPKKRGPKISSGPVNGFESNFGEAASIEQENAWTSLGYTFYGFIPIHLNYNEEPHLIQSNPFPNQVHFDTIMPNNGMPDDTHTLPNYTSSSYPSIASNLGYSFI